MIQAEHKKEGILLFDLDGTLWDSSQEVADSWNVILREQLPEIKTLTKEDIMSVMGKTMEEIAQTVLAGYQGDNARQVFKNCEIYENEYLTEHGAVLFPKVRETLENLRKAGYDMAVVSNCQTGYINAFYTSMKMSDLFCDMEEWGNTGKTKAENIHPQNQNCLPFAPLTSTQQYRSSVPQGLNATDRNNCRNPLLTH